MCQAHLRHIYIEHLATRGFAGVCNMSGGQHSEEDC